jgi:glutamate racemase
LDQNSPIGVFDSGLGGLTVTRAIRSALPNESLIYLGDTARVPYGTRSAQTIIRYARIARGTFRPTTSSSSSWRATP